MAGITVTEYEATIEKVFEHLSEADDMLRRLFEKVNFSTDENEEKQEFYEVLTRRVSRAARNLEVAHENIEYALDLGFLDVSQESDATTDPVS